MPSSPVSEHQQGVTEQEAPEHLAPASPGPEPERDLEAELSRAEDRMKRALADLDNYRKRSARETEGRIEEARERVLRDWLDALDSVERALVMAPGDAGLRAVLEQMETILARYGVERTGLPGETFDPEHHEAVSVRTDAAVPDRSITDVARSGWRRGDRTLRPAEVVVARRG